MTFIDFCSGIGGGRLGLELVGFKNLGFSEIDKEAIETYKSFFKAKNELEFGNLTKINSQNLPNFDILIAGFPCQSFSIVGKREGLDSKNGKIIYHIAEILKVKQPKFFILENVKGILSLDKGKALKEIVLLLEEQNYNVNFEVLNSLNFGLAQSRERVYFVGVRKDLGGVFNFLNLSELQKNANLKEFLDLDKSQIYDKNSKKYETFKRYLNNKYNKNRVNLDEILSRDFLVIDTRQSDLRVYENRVPTLRRDRHGIFYVYNKNLYRLSGLEALRLQGFYKLQNLEEKTKDLKDINLLKQSGNAMSVNVIEAIAKEIYYG